MANVNFYLKNNKNSNSLIFAYVSFKYFEVNKKGKKIFKQLKYSIGETINPKFWDTKKQLAKEVKDFPQYPEFNQRLKDIENSIMNVYRTMLNDSKEITPETLRNELTFYLESHNKIVSPPKQNKQLIYFINTVINETKRGERLIKKTGKLFKPQTVKKYITTYNNLVEYEKHINHTLKFEDITLEFYKKYVKYLNGKNYAVNTIGGHIKNIKVFMKIATQKGLNNNLDYSKEEFITVDEDVDTIYLTENELQKIYCLDLSKNKKLDHVRDTFIIGCRTGLRFSDLEQLKKEHFFENYIKITTIKTADTVVIPLHSTVKEIFNKYDYNLPRVISNQKMNEYLKELGKIAEINEKIVITETRGGLKISKNIEKYKLITVHTARRSFATNLFKAGIPTLSICKITGHKTEKSFLKYIKISNEENAELLMQHPYYKLSNNMKIAK